MVILVVDDEETLCDLLAQILAEKNTVFKAHNGKEAFDLARQHHPDMVISDVMMPEMSGLELLQALRADPETSKTLVILLSAAATQKSAADAEAFVKKPFDIDELEQVVADVAQTNRQCR